MRIRFMFSLSLLSVWSAGLFAQSVAWRGQVSAWLTGSAETKPVSQTGMRYLPELFLKKSLNRQWLIDADVSLNSLISADFDAGEKIETEGLLKPYRLWARISTRQFEARIGLQKINFGSATLFRPMMWFDRIDPRDPLKLTDGVKALLLRYYFQNNANIWLWGLYDNSDLKGWEIVPTEDNKPEFGGRLQLPVFAGEAGLAFHHRRADFSQVPLNMLTRQPLTTENRFAFDVKLDVRIGLWFEGALVQRDTDISAMKHQRLWTLGTDYTFGVGNGLYFLTEFFQLQSSDKMFGAGERIEFSGSSLNYPMGLLDQVSGIYYRDWTNHDNYWLLSWQRTYDNWLFYLIAFFNPETAQLNQNQNGSNAFAGNGFQLMVVFNH